MYLCNFFGLFYDLEIIVINYSFQLRYGTLKQDLPGFLVLEISCRVSVNLVALKFENSRTCLLFVSRLLMRRTVAFVIGSSSRSWV